MGDLLCSSKLSGTEKLHQMYEDVVYFELHHILKKFVYDLDLKFVQGRVQPSMRLPVMTHVNSVSVIQDAVNILLDYM